MNRRNVDPAITSPNLDHVIVRVESKSEAFPSSSSALASHGAVSSSHATDSAKVKAVAMTSLHQLPKSNGAPVEKRVSEETNDAIWEEIMGPYDLKTTAAELKKIPAPLENSCTSNVRQLPGSHLLLERMSKEGDFLEALRRGAQPRHRSLDLDIHINEPNIVVLEDNLVSKPLSDHLVDRGFSFRPKTLDTLQVQHVSPSSSQRIVRMVSISPKASPKPPPSPLQPQHMRCSPMEPRVDEEEEDGREGRASEAASSRSESKRKLIDPGLEVKLQLPKGHDTSGKTGGGEAGRASGASAAPSPAIERNTKMQSSRTVTLSKELLKIKTKSRLVEVGFPASPGASSPATTSGRYDTVKKSAPPSPTRPSVRKAEAEGDDEDPFKDIDLQDKFRQGNFKAITVAQWVSFFVVMGCLVCSLMVKELKGRQIWELELWKWFLLVFVVLCGRLVSGWLIRILVIIFEKNFLLRKKVLYFVYGLRKGVQTCLWLGLVLLAWKLMFDPHVERSTTNHRALWVVTRLLECFLIAAFIWLAKLLFVKSLASSFHVTTFFDRIQEALYNQHVLEALSGPPLLDLSYMPLQNPSGRAPSTSSMARGATGKKDEQNESIRIEDLQKMSSQNVSAGVMKRLMNLVKHPGIGTIYTTFDESVCVVDDESDDIEINSELEAKAAAKRIFKNVAQPGSRSIEQQDLQKFVTLEEIPKVLSLFEGAKDTGKITKKALKNWVVNVNQERKALAHSLNDTKTAVKGLHRMASVVVIIIIIVVWLLVLEIATTRVLVFVTSQLLLVGFIFSNTVKQVFEAVIFLFVMHPFDVGDRCIVDGTQLVVEEMKILSTVFLKSDNEKVFYPNSVLAMKPISNLYRSPDQKDILDFSVHISTPTEKITALKEKIAAYVEKKTEHWQPKFALQVKELEDLNRMRISVIMQHTINFQNFGERMNRRSELLLELKRIFAELGIEYRLLAQPVQLNYDPSASALLTNYPPPMIAPSPYEGQLI